MTDAQHHRPIRSYVLREGRFTQAQQRAFDRPWRQFGVVYPGQHHRLDLASLFGNDHPVFLEIGFGNGDALAEMAQAHPEHNYLGVEVHRPGVGHLLLALDAAGLQNVRIMRHDAIDILRYNLASASLYGVYLFFPDPWPKKRHHKRRIVQTRFVALLAEVIKPGGFVHMATDWNDYAIQMMDTVSASPQFTNAAGAENFTARPEDRPLTRFEKRGQLLGHEVWDLIFFRR